jgi:hypothetical protein
MAKKRWMLMAAGLLAAAVFAAGLGAQEGQRPRANHVSLGLSWLTALSDGMVTGHPGVQLSWFNPRLFTDRVGLGVHGGLSAAMYEKKFRGIAATLLAGPAVTIFDNGRFRLPLTLGVHADYFRMKDKSLTRWTWNIGAGAATDLIWQFGGKWYAYGRVQAACNFGAFEFLVTPGLGVGISL